MIPNPLTAARGFVMRKVAGRFDACRQLVSSAGVRVSHPSLLATAGVFVLMLMPILLALVAIGVALHLPGHSALHFAEVIPVTGAVAIRELKEKKATALTAARSVHDAAERENRSMSAEETTRYTAFMADVRSLSERITRSEALLEEERALAGNNPNPVTPPAPGDPNQRTSPRATPEYRSAFSRFLQVGRNALNGEEHRALSAGIDAEGGYTIAPEQFVTDLIRAVDNLVILRGLATKRTVATAASLGVPTLDADPDDFDWTTELAPGSEDSSMAFKKRKMIPHPFAKRIKVSKDFLRMSSAGGESLVRDRLAYKASITEEKGFMTGSGTGQALGIFTASADGIPTSRDVSTGNSSTAPAFDGLLGAKYALKEQYRRSKSLRWIFHPDVLLVIAKIKNGSGDYIWKESVRVGEPDTILGMPLMESQYAPNTMTSGLYVGALGDWSHYWIADALDLGVQRLDELYAETNQVGFIGRQACDGQFTLPEAAVRVKLG